MNNGEATPSVREHLGEQIQSTIGLDDAMPEGTVLKGWCCVAEWVDPEGNQWLTRVAGGPTGDSIPIWQIQGYLHNSLHEGFGDVDEDDES